MGNPVLLALICPHPRRILVRPWLASASSCPLRSQVLLFLLSRPERKITSPRVPREHLTTRVWPRIPGGWPPLPMGLPSPIPLITISFPTGRLGSWARGDFCLVVHPLSGVPASPDASGLRAHGKKIDFFAEANYPDATVVHSLIGFLQGQMCVDEYVQVVGGAMFCKLPLLYRISLFSLINSSPV
jgi:hypothetical protein